jgi:hypothetical protein
MSPRWVEVSLTEYLGFVSKIEKHRLKAALTQCLAHCGFGFFDGGCRIFAEAVQPLFEGSKIVTITRGCRRQPDHYGLLIGKDLILDGDGFYPDPFIWVQSFQRKENINGARLSVVFDYVESDAIPRNPVLSKKIGRILSPSNGQSLTTLG